MSKTRVDFLVEPVESVFFGPPRSFSAGEAHRAHSLFPPSPGTFQGMVRSRLLMGANPPLELGTRRENARREIARLVGEPDRLPESWQLHGPFPARHHAHAGDEGEPGVVTPWFPTPRFMLNKAGMGVHGRPIVSSHPGINDLHGDDTVQPPLIACPAENAVAPLGGWIGADNLYFALTGKGTWSKTGFSPGLPPFVNWELQPGLAIDPETATAQHGMLYFLGSLRFAPGSGLLGRFSGEVSERLSLQSLVSGAGAAGRKARPVRFSPVTALHPRWKNLLAGAHLPDECGDGSRWWLTLLTPTQSEGSALEPRLHVSPQTQALLRIETVLTGPFLSFGGYRMADGSTRANKHYLPAGTAWLLRIEGGDAKQRRAALDELHNSYPLGPRDEAGFGFGHCMIGVGPGQDDEEKI